MPDLKNPSSKGTKMEPVFFVNGKRAPTGLSDEGRRHTLGEVHHGGERSVVLAGLRESHLGRDAGRRLLHADRRHGPAAASADARGARPLGRRLRRQQVRHAVAVPHDRPHGHLPAARSGRKDPSVESPPVFAASSPKRLRADQLFNAITKVLGISGADPQATEPAAGKGKNRYARGPRAAVRISSSVSIRPLRKTKLWPDSSAGSVHDEQPVLFNALLKSRGETRLARLLADFPRGCWKKRPWGATSTCFR